MSVSECWRLQGLSGEDKASFAAANPGSGDPALHRTEKKSNATDAAVAAAIADRTLARARQLDAISAATIAGAVQRA